MARTQAHDYKQKRSHILNTATQLFADKGFHASSIMDIAKACDTSKSSLYHYFDSKEELLYEILHNHALVLSQSLLPIHDDPQTNATEKLTLFAQKLIFQNVSFRAQHKLILNELDALGEKQRQEITALLRAPIESIFSSLVEINPKLKNESALQFPVAMMFIGMINWTHTWFSGEGALTTDKFANLLCDSFINGFANVKLGQDGK